MLAASEMITFTEKLIEEIKHFPVLYDRRFMRSKDSVEKEDAWVQLTKRLPKDLNITVPETKKRWRTLKDCYSKFLRSGRTTNRFEARYRSWKWSRHMDYFKTHMLHSDSNDGDEITSPKSVTKISLDKRTKAYKMHMVNKKLRVDSDEDSKSEEQNERQKDVNEELNNKIVKGETLEESLDEVDEESYNAMANAVSDYADTPQSAGWGEVLNEPETIGNIKSFNRKSTSSVENENFIDPLMGRNFDALDLTFLGYASSIKKLSPRRQSLIKFSVAKIIMQEELAQQNEKERNYVHKTTKITTHIERL